MTDLSKILYYNNFDKVPAGTQLADIDGFANCSNATIVDKLSYAGGGKAVRTWIAKGDEGWGRWGFGYYGRISDLNIKAGGTIWWRQAFWHPPGSNLRGDHGSLKMMRIGRTLNGKNNGYVDVQVRNDRKGWRAYVEYGNEDGWRHFDPAPVVNGEWQMFEIKVYLHPTQGSITLWAEGKHVATYTGMNTMNDGAVVERLLQSTYWNGGSPKTQEMYYDEIAIAVDWGGRKDSQHLSRDADGNRYIGLATADQALPPPVTPPEPPPPEVTPPIEPPVEPPVEGIEGGITLTHGKTMVHVGDNAVMVTSDKPVVTG